MTLHPNDEITCVRCRKHLGWLVDQDAPAGFDLICDACAEREHIVPSAADREAWAKRWAKVRGSK